MSVYQSPYYILCNQANIPKSDDENSISNLGGECVEHYCIYLAKLSFANEFYMEYEHYLEKWILSYYKDPRIVKYVCTTPRYERDGSTYSCTKYSLETPYNILKMHIEYDEANRDTLFICSSICAKLGDDGNTKKEKINLVEYIGKIREQIVSDIKELNDEYFEELREECAIEYARDHC
jgi:hypothetical protein